MNLANATDAMKWASYLRQGYIAVDGERFGLTHLRRSCFTLVIEPTDRFEAMQLQIGVEFSSHCVSYGPKPNAPLDFDVLGHDRCILDHRNVARAFSVDRHRWSLKLPGLVHEVKQDHCRFTGRGNWLVMQTIDERGEPAAYEIYFQLRRQGENALRMVIESAYVRGAQSSAPGMPRDRKGRIRFHVMAAKVARGEPLREPRA